MNTNQIERREIELRVEVACEEPEQSRLAGFQDATDALLAGVERMKQKGLWPPKTSNVRHQPGVKSHHA